MKKYFLLPCAAILLCLLAGCSARSPLYQHPVFLSSKKTQGGVVTQHQSMDFEGLFLSAAANTSYLAPPESLDDVMNAVGPKGLVVAGRAVGLRQGHYKEGEYAYTLTTFQIDHVFYGQSDQNEITVAEGYALVEKDQRLYCHAPSGYTTKLQNDQLVLLYLTPDPSAKHQYFVAYPQKAFALQEGYLDYSEDYRKRLCAFYKGDRSVYQYQTETVETVSIPLPSGQTIEEPMIVFNKFWPIRNVSDDALIQELSDHPEVGMLLQTIEHFKVRIWPEYHVENPVDLQLAKERYIQRMQLLRQ